MLQTLIENDYIYVQVPYTARYKAKFLSGEWKEQRKMWRFPNNIHVMRALIKSFPELKINEEFMEYGRQQRAAIDKLLAIRSLHDHPGDWRLRPYQRVDVAYLKELTSGGVFNEPRTGKTPTILTVMKELGTVNNLIVCPSSLSIHWENEAKKWTEGVQIFRIGGTKKQREKMYQEWVKSMDSGSPSVVIISKDLLRSSSEQALFVKTQFDMMVVDEAHFLRNRDTKQSKAIMAINAKRRYALTGTPTVNHGVDLFGILQFLYPEKYPSYWGWVKRYFKVYSTYGTEIGGYREEHKKELLETVGMVCTQRKRKEVMQWLPEKTYIELPVDMHPQQRKAYQQMLDTFIAKLSDDSDEYVDAPSVLAQITKLRQICLDPSLIGIDAPSAKTDAVREWLEDNPQPVVIMSMFTSYLKKLKELLEIRGYKGKVGMLHGEMDTKTKAQAVHDFQSGKIEILLCNIISAGVGHTLDRADSVIFTDKAWNPTDQQQAEDRIVPVSEERNHAINVITFPIADTVDDMIDGILSRKESLTEVINSGAKEAIIRLIKGG